MSRRIAGVLALIAFALCLVEGLRAENSFATVLGRSLLALVVTLAIGLVIGAMAKKMIADGTSSAREPENK